MTAIINGSSPTVTFSDGTTQASAGLAAGGTIATGTITNGTVTTLTTTTISDGTNSTSSTNCIQGSAKAWVNFNSANPAVTNGSYNVSSVTRTANGQFTIAFTTALSSASYSSVIGISPASLTSGFNNAAVVIPSGASTTQLQIATGYNTSGTQAYVEGLVVSVAVFR
jgi:hypothetical protein